MSARERLTGAAFAPPPRAQGRQFEANRDDAGCGGSERELSTQLAWDSTLRCMATSSWASGIVLLGWPRSARRAYAWVPRPASAESASGARSYARSADSGNLAIALFWGLPARKERG